MLVYISYVLVPSIKSFGRKIILTREHLNHQVIPDRITRVNVLLGLVYSTVYQSNVQRESYISPVLLVASRILDSQISKASSFLLPSLLPSIHPPTAFNRPKLKRKLCSFFRTTRNNEDYLSSLRMSVRDASIGDNNER